ncbi:MAG: hypothetical protein WC708_01755 [Lentisphaeria bacterium]
MDTSAKIIIQAARAGRLALAIPLRGGLWWLPAAATAGNPAGDTLYVAAAEGTVFTLAAPAE